MIILPKNGKDCVYAIQRKAVVVSSTIELASPGVYFIKNLVTSKVYVGSSNHIGYRLSCHYRLLELGKHSSPYLQSSFTKHGCNAFRFEVLEVVSDNSQLLDREAFWINYYNASHPDFGYNSISDPTNGGRFWRKQRPSERLDRQQLGIRIAAALIAVLL